MAKTLTEADFTIVDILRDGGISTKVAVDLIKANVPPEYRMALSAALEQWHDAAEIALAYVEAAIEDATRERNARSIEASL